MLRVDFPSTRNPVPSTHTIRTCRPIRATRPTAGEPESSPEGPCSHCGPPCAACLHCAYAERRTNTSEHVSTVFTSTSISQDVDVSLPPAAESPSHLVRSASFEAQQSGRSRLIAAYTFVELTPASLAIRQRHSRLPRLGPRLDGLLDRNSFEALSRQLGHGADHCHLPTSDRFCLWPRGGLVWPRQDDTSASQAPRPSVLQPWAS